VQKTYYTRRIFARAIDFLLVGLIVLIFEKLFESSSSGIFLFFLLYNSVVTLLEGRTLGKYVLSLVVRSERTGFKRSLALLIREPLLFILSPLIFFNVVYMSPVPLHDRITGVKVVRDERDEF